VINRLIKTVALVVALTVLLIAGVAPPAASDSFVLARNAKNPTARLSAADLKDIFIGRKKVWPHGAVVAVVVGAPGSPELKWLSESLLHVPESVLMTKIRQEVFKGEMRRPIVTTSDKETLTVLAANPGAIGVVRSESAAAATEGVAVLQTF
jgi:ABC-type phosphate transport system substrate-binding protein